MFCPNCGTQSTESASFCANCGFALAPKTASAPQTAPAPQFIPPQPSVMPGTGLVGFSQRINDPAYTSLNKKSQIWIFLFAAIISVAFIVGFPIYGNTSGDIDFPKSLYYGLGLGGMFCVIAIITSLRKAADKTWDGVIENKRYYRVEDSDDDGGFTTCRYVYELRIRKDSGKVIKMEIPGGRNASIYEYYNEGDKVRHHKGLHLFEKYDKSRDTQILCVACTKLNDINADKCKKCKTPLLNK